ncbi:MAG: organic solvent tolerance protein [Rhizobium sp.]|nr:organic solvent tolerance protein [Rhizobium sp.]
MAAGDRKFVGKLGAILLTGVVALGFLLPATLIASAQSTVERPLTPKVPENSKMLLTSSELIYDQDSKKVVATGGVQIDYGGYKLVAKRVEYDQKSGRMMAIGEIEMVEPSGNRIYADKLDITDDFANGFLNALRIETTDNTRLVAVKGRRINSDEMILEKGVYTACEPCKQHPEKPPLWQVKAERVIQNGKTHTVRLESARFELFGKPIAFIPVLELPDNTVKRKSGFLFPRMSTSQNLGFGLGLSYYQTLTPHMDATLTVTGYTTQGALVDAEFRQQFKYGLHTFHIAGIDQINRKQFTSDTADYRETQRLAVSSKAQFKINPRWTFGWDVLVQSDNNFARTYSLFDSDQPIHTNQIYLTGLGRRNSFDMRSFYFDVQDADIDNLAEHKQAVVHPVMDYNYIHPSPVLGGQLSATVNFQSLTRTTTDRIDVIDGMPVHSRFPGIAGTSDRFTTETDWKRTFIVPGGLMITPMLAARGDGFRLDNNSAPSAYAGDYYTGTDATRYMLTAGIEARYPILMTTDNSSHIFEPIVQVYARPDEQLAGALPNEDAQSFVFDASNLFERDKFSGFDRVEGGTRANIGIRYTGTFDSGYTIRSIFGQSYQLAGKNSFASHDLVNVGADSGLETDVSDYVGAAGIEIPNGLTFSLGGRVDEKSFNVRRTDSTIGYNGKRLQTEITYSRIAAQPDYGYPTDGEEVQTTSSIKIKDNWTVYSSLTWDMNNNVLSRRGIGFGYDDSCTVFAIGFTQTRDIANTSANDWQIGARLSFRTLGDVNVGDPSLPVFNQTYGK